MSKRKRSTPHLIRGTYHLSQAGIETEEIRSLILRRRLQVLVHSYIYYELDSSVVDDHTWQRWANELVELQRDHPSICERVDYHKYFKDFDGSTGYDLPFRNPEIARKAQQIYRKGGERNGRGDQTIRLDFSGAGSVHHQ